jgi:hypothetical protein
MSRASTRVYVGDVQEQALERKFVLLRRKSKPYKMGRSKGLENILREASLFVEKYQIHQTEKDDMSRTCSMRSIY